MNIALRQPMSRDDFLDWAGAQDGAWEFDGHAPVAMTGGNALHNRLMRRLMRLLEDKLAGSGCEAFGPDLGVATVANAVRYPDALVACSATDNPSKLAAGVVVVFEILSPGSGHTDRIIKSREYAAVPSIQRYVIVEQVKAGFLVFERSGDGWRASVLTDGALSMLEIGVTLGIGELYDGLGVPDAA